MRKLEKTLYLGAAYTVLIASAFYIFALAAKLESTSLGIGKFFLIFAFGMICAIAELVYGLLDLRKWLKAVIHYAILLTAFCVIFLLGDFFLVKGASSVFVAITLFTAMYAIFVGTLYLIRKTVSKADDALDKKTGTSRKNGKKDEKPKADYTPRFK